MSNATTHTVTIRKAYKGATLARIPAGSTVPEAHDIIMRALYPQGMDEFDARQIADDHSWAIFLVAALVDRVDDDIETAAEDAGWIITVHLGSQCAIDYGTEL